jgi:hypothetical protein
MHFTWTAHFSLRLPVIWISEWQRAQPVLSPTVSLATDNLHDPACLEMRTKIFIDTHEGSWDSALGEARAGLDIQLGRAGWTLKKN